MAIQPILNFTIQLQGDGTATAVSIPLSSAPICFTPDATLAEAFALGSLSLAGVENLTCSDASIGVTGAISGTMLNLTFSPAPVAGTQYTVSGTFLF